MVFEKKLDEELKKFKPNVAVDLDATIANYDGWKGIEHIGDPFPGVKEFLEQLSKHFEIVIHSSRGAEGPEAIEYVKNYLDKHKLPYSSIWDKPGKPKAMRYIDDRALRCDPKNDPKAYDKALKQCLQILKK